MRRRSLAFVGVLLVAGASIVHADEKADDLVQQVQQSIRSSVPLAADYTITLTDRDEKLTAHGTRIYKEVHSEPTMAGIWAVVFSPNGKALAVGNYDGTVQLFDPATWQSSRLLEGHTDPVTSVAFSPDGSLLATASTDKTVRLWNPRTGKTVRTLPGEDNFTWSVAFSPDGKLLATQHQGVHLWDVTTGQEVKKLEGKTNEAMRVVFSPDGGLLRGNALSD